MDTLFGMETKKMRKKPVIRPPFTDTERLHRVWQRWHGYSDEKKLRILSKAKTIQQTIVFQG